MLKAGDSFERYTIEAPIGHGGMGTVYRAEDTRLGRRVALKVISDRVAGPQASARLVREARAAAALDHPNAVAIFDAGEVNGAPYIVMELVEGRTLRAAIEDRSVPFEARIAQLADVGRALGAAHKRGLVHRDVKPENVMIRTDGMVKVLDFGIARRTSGEVDPAGPTQTPAISTLTIDGLKLGTPVYMAPEQIKGAPLDGRADQFSWGVVVFEHLTGELPWRGSDALSAMASALTDPANREALEASRVPDAVQEVVLRALAKRPEDRFPSMEEAVRALTAAARGEAVPAKDPPRAAESPEEPAPPGATMAQRFSTQDVREVLSRAVDRQAEKEGAAKLGFEDLLAIAAEVGVDPESLREASRALRAKGDPKKEPSPRARGPAKEQSPAPEGTGASGGGGDEQLVFGSTMGTVAQWLRRRKRELRIHAVVFGVVNVAVLVLGLVLLSFTPWWIWPMVPLLWGIGLAIHAYWALTLTEDDWAEEKDQRRFWMEERRRRHEERLAAIQRGVPFGPAGPVPPWMRMGQPPRDLQPPIPREATRGPRPRGEAGARVPQGEAEREERLRLASDTNSEQAAEEEASEAEQAGTRRRQRR